MKSLVLEEKMKLSLRDFPIERDEVMVHGARRREADRLGDLTHRRRIAALLDGSGDAVEDSLPSLLVVPGQDSLRLSGLCAARLAERMF